MNGVIKPIRTTLSKDGVQQPLGDAPWRESVSGRQIVLSRGLCAFNLIRLDKKLSAQRQRQAAELQALAKAPFEDPGLYIVIEDGAAQAWSWDRAFVEDKTGLPSRLCVPETILHPAADGVVLRDCIDGFEGQHWVGGYLQQSRWWPYRPTTHDWRLFQSSLQGAVEIGGASIPAATPVNLATEPLRSNNRRPLISTLKSLRPMTVAVLASWIILPLLAFHLVSLLVISQQTSSLRNDVTALQQELGPKRLAATQLGQIQTELEAYAERLNVVSPLPGFSAILTRVAAAQGTIQSASLVDSNLAVTFRVSEPINQVEWVRELEATPALREVSVFPSIRMGDWAVEATLVGVGTLQQNSAVDRAEGAP